MRDLRGLIIGAVAAAVFLAVPILAAAQEYTPPNYPPPTDMQQWLADTAQQKPIPPGTAITTSNWRQYKAEMSYGLQTLYSGKYFWKIPTDSAINVGPTMILSQPKTYLEATEKYGSQTSIGVTPSGHRYIRNYQGGMPFPDAFSGKKDPQKGYKILADDYLSWVPDLYAQPFGHPGVSCTQDRFGNIACTTLVWIYTQVGWNTDPGVPQNYPHAGNAWFTQWFTVVTPEQSRYTTNLTVFYKDPEKDQDDYVFVPALRRSLRLAVTARCAPAAGSDLVLDDYFTPGFNGGLALFDATYLGHRKILILEGDFTHQTGHIPEDWDMPLGFPKPSWGKWQLRDTDVIDVRRIPSERAGYCYGSRIMYVDSVYHYAGWLDIFDSALKHWKIQYWGSRAEDVPPLGHVNTNSVTLAVWDVQNDHATYLSTYDPSGVGPYFNNGAPPQYHNFTRFCSPSGLMQVMQ
ncbi:MAG: DUF1329 domain-containing protein [Candidatus Binataceae bacterium]